MSATVSMKEIISLRVKPGECLSRYKDGYYFNLDVNKLAPIIYRNNSKIIKEVISTDDASGYYSVRNSMNEQIIIANTGHEDSVLAQQGLTITNARCFYCTRDVKKPIGYPVKTTREVYCYKDVYRVTTIYWTNGRFCDLRCAYSYLLNNRSSSITEVCVQLLKKLAFDLGYENIRPANEMSLLKCNGGCLEDNKWSDEKLEYIIQEGLVLFPAQQGYIETSVNRTSY